MKEWTVDEEIKLFHLIGDFTPIGEESEKNLGTIVEKFDKKYKSNDIIEKLETLYNLKWFNESDSSSSEEEKVETPKKRTRAAVKEEKKQTPTTRRRTRNDEPAEDEEPAKKKKKEDSPKPTRRSSRVGVRRSSRKK